MMVSVLLSGMSGTNHESLCYGMLCCCSACHLKALSFLLQCAKVPQCHICNALKRLLTSHIASLLSVSKQHDVLHIDTTPERETLVSRQVAVYK